MHAAEEVRTERSLKSESPQLSPPPADSQVCGKSEYEKRREKNIAENKALFKEMFGDSVWGDEELPKVKGKGKGKQSKS